MASPAVGLHLGRQKLLPDRGLARAMTPTQNADHRTEDSKHCTYSQRLTLRELLADTEIRPKGKACQAGHTTYQSADTNTNHAFLLYG
jgi:hypothetical protein